MFPCSKLELSSALAAAISAAWYDFMSKQEYATLPVSSTSSATLIYVYCSFLPGYFLLAENVARFPEASMAYLEGLSVSLIFTAERQTVYDCIGALAVVVDGLLSTTCMSGESTMSGGMCRTQMALGMCTPNHLDWPHGGCTAVNGWWRKAVRLD